MRRLLSSPSFLLFVGAFLVYVAGARGYIDSGDAQGRFAVAHRMWNDGSIFLSVDDPWMEASEIRAFTEDGQGISFYGLAQSVTMLPGVIVADLGARVLKPGDPDSFKYLASQFFFTMLVLPFFAALSLVWVRVLALRMGMTGAHATWTAVALGFATFWMAYAKTVGMNVEVCFFLLAGVVVYTGGEPSRWRLAVTSLLLGVTFHYRQECLIPVALMLAVFTWDTWKRGAALAGTILHLAWPCVIWGVLVLWHNYVRSGSIFESFPGYFELYNTGEQSEALAGSRELTDDALMFGSWPAEYLWPALFGLKKGLFWYSPVLFAMVLWPLRGVRGWHRSMSLALLPVVGFLLFVGSLRWVIYEGGWGPRYLLPVLPFLVIGASYGLRSLVDRPVMARGLAVFVIAAALFQVAVTFEGNNHLLDQSHTAHAERNDDPDSWQYSLLLGRMRHMGIDFFDDPGFQATWSSETVQQRSSRTEDHLWWLKLGAKTGNPLAKWGLAIIAIGALAMGLWALKRALRVVPVAAVTP